MYLNFIELQLYHIIFNNLKIDVSLATIVLSFDIVIYIYSDLKHIKRELLIWNEKNFYL